MKVEFKKMVPPGESASGGPHQPVEYIVFAGGRLGKDELHRVATDADRAEHRLEYLAFKAEGAPVAVASEPAVIVAPESPGESDYAEPEAKAETKLGKLFRPRK